MDHTMDTKSFPKTSLFDQISFLMVGAIAMTLIIGNAWYFFTLPLPVIDFGSVLAWLILSYFMGHLIQVASNVLRDIPMIPLLDWESNVAFLPYEQELLKEAEEYFKTPAHKERPDHLWNLCYILGMTKDSASQVETFSAYYNLYRGWFMAFFIETLFLLYFLITAYTHGTLWMTLFSAITALLFYRRAHRFWQYLRDKVFGIFTIVRLQKTVTE